MTHFGFWLGDHAVMHNSYLRCDRVLAFWVGRRPYVLDDGLPTMPKIRFVLSRWCALILIFSSLAHSSLSTVTAQEKTARLGVLVGGSPATTVKYLDSLRVALQNFGYEQGRNITIEPRYAMGDYSRLPVLANELVEHKVRVILAGNERALIAAKNTGADIPIVVVACDPLEKLLGSLARPGGNATGISCVSADLISKRFSLLKAAVPDLERVALLYNPEDISEFELREADHAGELLQLKAIRFPVKSPDDFKAAFDMMQKENCKAIYVSFSAFTNFHAPRLSQLALSNRLALISSGPEFAEAGGLISYGATLVDAYKRSAYFIDRILKGASPKELPAEEPIKFYLVINKKTAAILGLKIPDNLLSVADDVIE
jgi:putative tryptophan/tyrosine transport system substrate-binding protein